MKKKNLFGIATPPPGCHLRRHTRGIAKHAVAALLLFFILAATGHCEEIPWSGRNFFHISENQLVKSFLEDLFMSEGILADISASIEGSPVSGKFDMPAEQVFQQITSAFNLLWYYDGQIVYISPANEIESMTIPIEQASLTSVKQSLDEMGIADLRYPLRYYPNERVMMVQGPRSYVKRVSEALNIIQKKRTDPPARRQSAQGAQRARVFRLKYAWAADRQLRIGDRTITIPGVASILKGMADQSSGSGSQSVDYGMGAREVRALENVAQDAKQNEEQAKQAPADGTFLIDSRHTIQCAERLNAVIVNTNPINMASYEELIAELDVPLQLIEIKASIIDVDRNAMRSIGLSFNGAYPEGDNVYTYSSDLIPGSNPLFELNQIPAAGVFGGLGFSAILGDQADNFLAIRLKALESKGQARVVSKPSIITFDNHEARFTNSETFYVRVAAQEDASLYQISAGITLKVTPHLIQEDQHPRIQLMIAIEDGKIKGNMVDSIPIVENSTLNTQAVVSGNESLLIGGLIYDAEREVVRKVPLLGDIPLIGLMFRSKDKVNSKTERLFLISPRLLNVDGNANVVAMESKGDMERPYRNWPPVKLFETTF